MYDFRSSNQGGLSSLFDHGAPPRGGLSYLLGSPPEYRVLEISKPGGSDNPHTRITALHGVDEAMRPWSLPTDDILRLLALPETQRPIFYVLAQHQKVNVRRAQGLLREYLTTDQDGVEFNNLTALPNRLG